ncbi:hypothetical protein HY523_00130 [Candidatus Berkelbacteria bacterium]|nr:hypothetical protein [Candidatus Berkelbacteria bacterium]
MADDPTFAKARDKEGVKALELTPESLKVIRGMLDQADHYLKAARQLLMHESIREKVRHLGEDADHGHGAGDKVIEGVFDGEQMLGRDERRYPVPPNYASKSKLVVGDVLKLTIATDGTFIFKQIGPVERTKLLGTLEEEHGTYVVATPDRRYRVLQASVTYFRAQVGDQLTVVVPRDGEADWAAVENIVQDEEGQKYS